MTYFADSVVCDYGVFEGYLDKKGKVHKDLKLICNRRDNALLIAEIMNKDQKGEYGGTANMEGADNEDID